MDQVPVFKPAQKLPARTPLEERMRVKMEKGQATWPEPLLGLTCAECCYFDQTEASVAPSSAKKGKGRCRRLAQMRAGSWGVAINGTAIACSEFGVEEGEE